MAKKTSKGGGSAFLKTGRHSASLDHWIGPSQFEGDGVSTDPAINWDEPKAGVVRHNKGEEVEGA